MKHDNVNRYAEFCQFRAEVRGSADYLIIGIDVAKQQHHASQYSLRSVWFS